MIGGFDFVKAGRMAAVVLRHGRTSALKIASTASVELKQLANDVKKINDDFPAANGAAELVKKQQ